jgi:hypothetical protein
MLDAKTAKTATPWSLARRNAERFRLIGDYLERILVNHPYVFLALASLLYFVITIDRAHRKLFWFDELFTFYITQLPDLGSIWTACRNGADFNPPLLYVLTRWSQALFGATELGTRIPQILGFWLFCLCLYRFVSVRAGAVAGFIALLFPLTAGGYWYAYEARAYGLVLGFFGIALICWQAADGKQRHWATVAGLAASLTAAVLCHCFAFLLFIPLGLSELTRVVLRKRIDPWMWCALLLPAVAWVVTVVPLLQASKRAGLHNAIRLPPEAVLNSWDLSFDPHLAFAVLLLLSAQAVSLRTSPFLRAQGSPGADSGFAGPEIATIVGTLSIPAAALMAAWITGAPYFGRYSLIAMAGVACLVGAACTRSRIIGLSVLSISLLFITVSFAWFRLGSFVTEPITGTEIGTRPAAGSFLFEWIGTSAPGSDPIVLMDDLEFAPMFHYAPPSIRWRFVFLIPEINGDGYLRLQRCCGAPGTISMQAAFLATHRTFFAYGRQDRVASETKEFQRNGGQITVQTCRAEHCLYRIAFLAPPSATTAAPGEPNTKPLHEQL